MANENAERLKRLQAEPLERKIMITQARIIEWYEHFDGKVYLSFSGGKDSSVLLGIAREIYPDIPAVFVNTGLEYPEIRKFALSHENVEELRPRWGRAAKKNGKRPEDVISFMDTLKRYGYPVISKAVSNAIGESRSTPGGSRWARLHAEYKRRDGGRSQYDYSKYLPLFNAPFKISDKCCQIFKKGPAHIFQHQTGRQPIIATMTEESLIRKQAWLTQGGCNAFNARIPVSKPMSFWTEQDVLHYITYYNRPLCSVYGEIVVVGKGGLEYPAQGNPLLSELNSKAPLRCTGCERTGCIFCAFGLHLERGETRFQRLKHTHPQPYEFCIDGGEWARNPDYDPAASAAAWNPRQIWQPSKKGLGMGKVFDMVNEIYGKDFIRYE